MKKILSILLCITVMLVFTLTACKKPSGNSSDLGSKSSNVETSNSQVGDSSNNQDISLSKSFTTSDVFDYSANTSATNSNEPIVEPGESAQASYPELYAMYKISDLDGSYNGTNKEIGFFKTETRTNNTFTTYPIGYGEGTTGGRGATAENIYECSTGLEVLSALEGIKTKQATNAELKSIIKITGEITQANSTAIENPTNNQLVFQIVPNSINNLTIIGVNQNAIFNGVGINFKSCDNIIVQNLTIHHPSQVLKNEKDCLEFNECNYVWVDHCELYNDAPTSSGEKDYYDGLIDVKNQSSHVTISYNYIHDAWKTSLVGSGPDDLCETRTISYHHNIFQNVNSRVPAIRSGYGHIYNNYYKDIKSSGANCRIEADVYIENNIFENCKKPICADEDSIKGFYNISNNVFTSCSSVPTSSTTDFTPSYLYILDGTENLKTYLNATVGVNKIDVATQCAMDDGYNKKYVIDENLLIDRAIDELPTISLNNDSLQRLLYLSKSVLFASDEAVSKLTNLSKLVTAVNNYINLYTSDLNQRISAINFNANFSKNALEYLKAVSEYEKATDLVKNKITAKSTLDSLTSDYNQNFTTYFNAQVDALKNATKESMSDIEGLLSLYDKKDSAVQQTLKYQELQDAYILSKAHIVASEFEALVTLLPSATNIAHSDSTNILNAVEKFNALTEKQYSLVSASSISKFSEVYNKVAVSVRKMDVSGITEKKVSTESAKAGDVNLSKNMEVWDTTTTFEGKSYTKTAYISGYGNKGTKSIWFTVYSPCDITIVLNTIDGAGKFVIADKNGNVLKNFTTENAEVTKITISDLALGEYRLYTAMPDGTYTATKAYIYDFIITPKS